MPGIRSRGARPEAWNRPSASLPRGARLQSRRSARSTAQVAGSGLNGERAAPAECLAVYRKRAACLVLFVSVLRVQALSTVLKLLFERPGPDLAPNTPKVSTSSVPSGRATIPAVWIGVGSRRRSPSYTSDNVGLGGVSDDAVRHLRAGRWPLSSTVRYRFKASGLASGHVLWRKKRVVAETLDRERDPWLLEVSVPQTP